MFACVQTCDAGFCLEGIVEVGHDSADGDSCGPGLAARGNLPLCKSCAIRHIDVANASSLLTVMCIHTGPCDSSKEDNTLVTE